MPEVEAGSEGGARARGGMGGGGGRGALLGEGGGMRGAAGGGGARRGGVAGAACRLHTKKDMVSQLTSCRGGRRQGKGGKKLKHHMQEWTSSVVR